MKRTLQPIVCKLCGETHPSNGIHTHLKYKHDGMTTAQYRDLFGDFRVNTKKYEDLKVGKPVYQCLLCNDGKTYTSTALSFHLIKHHGTNKQSYILETLLDGKPPTCKCGCGKPTKINSYDAPYATEYISGHNKSTLGHVFSDSSREKMSKSAIERLNRNRKTGIKSPMHTRSNVFKRSYGTIDIYNKRLQLNGVECLSNEQDISTDGVMLSFRCLATGKTFTQTQLNAYSPFVTKTKSRAQDEIVQFIREILPSIPIIENTQKVLDEYKEIDIYLPSLKVGIEFDGLYYHSEVAGKKNRLYHIQKTEDAGSKHIRLIHVFEDEWRDKRPIVQSKLKSLLGVYPDRRIFARKCVAKEIDPSTKSEFLDKYHIQGNDRSDTKLGLFSDGELVAVMTFSRPNVAKGKTQRAFMELSRYATKYNVIGGAGKLITYYRKSYKGTIVTYADLRWTCPTDNLYLKLGFKLIGQTQCNYFYLDGRGKRLHRFNFTKASLVANGGDPTKTEWEIMQSRGYDRIWDCGHLKYQLDL